MSDLTKMGINQNVPESSGEFEVIPSDKYPMVITSEEMKDNSKKSGKVLTFFWQVVKNEQYKGITIKEYLNITNTSKIAQEIGQGVLKRICSLTGVPFPPPNTQLMYGKPMLNTVKVEEFKSNTSGETLKSNKITAHNPMPENYAQTTAPKSSPPPPVFPDTNPGEAEPPPIPDNDIPW